MLGRQLASVERLAGGQADVARDRRDGRRVVAGEDEEGEALVAQVADGLARLWTQLLGKDGEPERLRARRRARRGVEAADRLRR